jgi:hypothetical protein
MVPAQLAFTTEAQSHGENKINGGLQVFDFSIFLLAFSVPQCLRGERFLMSLLKLKIDVSGTLGDAAWREIRQFDQIQSADFGPQFGSGGRCNHPPDAPHAKGEWIGAEIRLQTPLLAQYAMSHYLEQERVLDADVE